MSVPNLAHPDRNEDAIAYDAKGGWAAVLDGVGGTKAGKEASNKALEEIRQKLSGWNQSDNFNVKEILKSTFARASLAVQREVPDGLTTAVVSIILPIGDEFMNFIASVGDSRAYLYRDNTLIKLTTDDSIIPGKLSDKIDNVSLANELSEIELRAFDQRNIVTQALGQEESLDVHIYPIIIKTGDKFILATDGVHDNLTFKEMEEVAGKGGDVSKLLVEMAKKRSQENHFRSKPDDISAVVIEIN